MAKREGAEMERLQRARLGMWKVKEDSFTKTSMVFRGGRTGEVREGLRLLPWNQMVWGNWVQVQLQILICMLKQWRQNESQTILSGTVYTACLHQPEDGRLKWMKTEETNPLLAALWMKTLWGSEITESHRLSNVLCIVMIICDGEKKKKKKILLFLCHLIV